MIRNHQFNIDETHLTTLRKVDLTLAVGLTVCLLMVVVLLLLSVVLAPKIPEALWALLVAVPFLLGVVACIVLLPKVKNEFTRLRRRQREVYLWWRRREWRDQHESTSSPDWIVVDKWEKGRHLYGLVEPGDLNGVPERWEDPLKPRARKVSRKSKNPKDIKR